MFMLFGNVVCFKAAHIENKHMVFNRARSILHCFVKKFNIKSQLAVVLFILAAITVFVRPFTVFYGYKAVTAYFAVFNGVIGTVITKIDKNKNKY